MPQFILIDHSIQDTTGHHYEYAVRVLEAAKQAGYAPVLAANAQFAAGATVPWPLFKVYRHGFWPRMATTLSARAASRTLNRIIRAVELVRVRLFFSRLGLLWLIRDRPVTYLKSHPFDSPFSLRTLALAALIGVPLRIMLALAMLVPFRAYVASVFKSLWTLCRAVLVQSLDAISPAGSLANWRFARRKRRSFADGTLRLLRSLKLTESDIVFVPTLGEPEMLALLDVFRRSVESARPSYHLLFRRNLYEGYDPDYETQDPLLLPVRNAFLRFRSALSGSRVFFYTDTEELSRQFNRLKIFSFRTCPIPHTLPAESHRPQSPPLRLTYLGDARAEKGYQLLPATVQDLWPMVKAGKVIFVLQSNYNVEPGEPEAVVARSQLRSYPRSRVELIERACTSDEYHRLLLNADVLVLPYDQHQYYARSSGVVIEALAAGIPVVAPATSWLARQFTDAANRYLASLCHADLSIAPLRHHWVIRGEEDEPCFHGTTRPPSFAGESRTAHTRIRVPKGCRLGIFSIDLENPLGRFARMEVTQLGAGGNAVDYSAHWMAAGYNDATARVVFRIHGDAVKLRIALSNAFSDGRISLNSATVRFVMLPEGHQIPLSAVGVAYTPGNGRALSSAVAEIVTHFDHYKRTAVDHSRSVYRFHNAGNLVQVLASASQPATEVSRHGA